MALDNHLIINGLHPKEALAGMSDFSGARLRHKRQQSTLAQQFRRVLNRRKRQS
jgi:hypothetical protein